MPRAVGDSPFLRKQTLTRLIETNASSLYEKGFPLQQLFSKGNNGSPRLVTSAEGLVPVRTAARRRGRLHARPSSADLFKAARMGFKQYSTLFQRYKGQLSADAVARLAYPLPGEVPGAAAMQQEAERELLYIGRTGAETVLREREILCGQLLAQQTVSVTVDEATISVDTGIDAPTDSSAPWATDSTHIPADLGRFLRLFRRKTGGDPTHIIYHGKQTENFAKNDDIYTWSERFMGRGAITDLPMEMLPQGLQGAEIMVVDAFYEELDGTSEDFWPEEDIMTWLNLSEPDLVLDQVTVGTLADEFQGDMYGRRVIDQEDDSIWVHAGGNSVPMILDAAQVMQFDLTGP